MQTTASPVVVSLAVENFDRLPDSALLPITDAVTVCGRSRSSVYRHAEAGELHLIKVGNSTRVRVGELRRLMGIQQ